jgi:hypothetical protein
MSLPPLNIIFDPAGEQKTLLPENKGGSGIGQINDICRLF